MASTHPKVNPGRLISLVDYKWRTDRLPNEDIVVPMEDLPDPDADHGATSGCSNALYNGVGGGRSQQYETLRDIERKWDDLALYRIHRGSPSVNGNHSTVRPSSGNSTMRATSTPAAQGSTGGGISSATSSGH